jgi:mannose-6-phosphate isomerase-like protein (cupin superfamily)
LLVQSHQPPSISAAPPARRAVIHTPEGGERLNVVGDGIRILADSRMTGGACVIFETVTSPGMGPPLHRHGRDDEHFFIVEGAALFQVDGERYTVSAGGFAFVPRGSVHTFMNPGASPLRMIVTCSPGGIEEPFRETHRLGAEGKANAQSVTAAFLKFDLEIMGPPIRAE